VELVFERVVVRAFRNIAELVLEPSPRLNVIAGENGQGKTSLIEALYVVATSKSFRTDKLREVVQQGEALASVTARVRDAGLAREQRFALGPEVSLLTLDGKRPGRRAAYATRTPVVVFHPGDLALASGTATIRRTLLDRIALFVEPASADHRQRYQRAMRERQKTLEERGPGAVDLDAFETLMAREGAALSRARLRAAERLLEALVPAFTRMAPGKLALDARYVPGGSRDESEFAAELRLARARDLRRRAATYGPHKDELELSIDGRSARHHASQGQQRVLALALKIAELECVRAARGAHPVLLLDDVSSELDPARTGAVYDLVSQEPSQVFVTTTRPELFVTPARRERLDLVMREGRLSVA
jgi:DNA replication and repair protein RecF